MKIYVKTGLLFLLLSLCGLLSFAQTTTPDTSTSTPIPSREATTTPLVPADAATTTQTQVAPAAPGSAESLSFDNATSSATSTQAATDTLLLATTTPEAAANNTWKILVAAVAVVLAGIAAYFGFNNKKEDKGRCEKILEKLEKKRNDQMNVEKEISIMDILLAELKGTLEDAQGDAGEYAVLKGKEKILQAIGSTKLNNSISTMEDLILAYDELTRMAESLKRKRESLAHEISLHKIAYEACASRGGSNILSESGKKIHPLISRPAKHEINIRINLNELGKSEEEGKRIREAIEKKAIQLGMADGNSKGKVSEGYADIYLPTKNPKEDAEALHEYVQGLGIEKSTEFILDKVVD